MKTVYKYIDFFMLQLSIQGWTVQQSWGKHGFEWESSFTMAHNFIWNQYHHCCKSSQSKLFITLCGSNLWINFFQPLFLNYVLFKIMVVIVGQCQVIVWLVLEILTKTKFRTKQSSLSTKKTCKLHDNIHTTPTIQVFKALENYTSRPFDIKIDFNLGIP